jgi:hypothetical protein
MHYLCNTAVLGNLRKTLDLEREFGSDNSSVRMLGEANDAGDE